MKVAIIGRTEILYDSMVSLRNAGYEIACILTAKEAPESTRTASDFRAAAAAWGIPFAQGSQILQHAGFLASVGANVAVSVNYTAVIPQSIVEIFPLGILNAHGGDLPRYRGNACQAWAILNGEKHIGLCIHRMVGGELDSGDIVARDYFAVDDSTKVTWVLNWMTSRTPELVVEALRRLELNPGFILERQSKDQQLALRCYPRTPEDGRIDWAKPAIDVVRLVNASNKPYAGAYCNFEGDKLVIWDARIVDDDEVFCAVPGQITKIGDGYVDVACGVGKIRVVAAEYRGDTVTPAAIIKSIRKRLT
jgi:methionyl-tRNA formyltransferase